MNARDRSDRGQGPADDGADDRGDEAFFARWSRRKQAARAPKAADAPVLATEPEMHAGTVPAEPATTTEANDTASATTGTAASGTAARPLTEDDFKDVDFDTLDYASDYGRFMQPNVPDSIRQKALSKLWQSDPIFTQVDPFQDYAGDYTDAAVVPATGVVKTIYKVGQGFLSDDEAHAWTRVGKPPLATEMAALAVVRPGYRVRLGTAADLPALIDIQRRAILAVGTEAYGRDVAESWAAGLVGDGMRAHLDAGDAIDVALDEETGQPVASCGYRAGEIMGLFVDPGHARRGLARALLGRALSALEQRAAGPVRVVATRPSLRLYVGAGFRPMATRPEPTRGGQAMEVFDMTRERPAAVGTDIARETPDQPEVRAFLAASEAYASALYPAESNHFVDVEQLAKPNVVFLVARDTTIACGCGAIVRSTDGTAEIKRMWVAPEARGRRVGRALLDALITAARQSGAHALRLETGIAQPEALGLYRAAGFVEIGPFGDYKPDPLSVFMERRLDA